MNKLSKDEYIIQRNKRMFCGFKITRFLFVCCAMVLNSFSLSAQDIDEGYVVYTDSIKEIGVGQMRVASSGVRRNGMSVYGTIQSRLGKIKAVYDDDNWFISDGVIHCLRLAMDAWENKIDIKTPVEFFVCMSEDLSPDVAINTTVRYVSKSRLESMPDNLFRQDFPLLSTACDTITINALVDWNFSWLYDSTDDGSVNLTNGFLRHIAYILGFGSSVVKRAGGIGFSIPMTPSVFDKLLTNGESSLYKLKTSTKASDFENFFSKPLNLYSSSFNYKMYNYGNFIPGKSGCYFSLGFDNIMEFPQSDEDTLLSINIETLNVMQVLGWNMVPQDIEIQCNNTNLLGYGSVYQTLNFVAQKVSTKECVNVSWSYQVYNPVAAIYETYSTAAGEVFSVTPDIIKRGLDEFQCLQARVVANVFGMEYIFPLSLETRPLVENVETSNYVDLGNGLYSFDISLSQKGATGGTIVVSDGVGMAKTFNLSEHLSDVGPMVKGYKVYIKVNLTNNYGTCGHIVQMDSYNPYQQTKTNKNMNIHVRVNGMSGEDTFRDGNVVNLSLTGISDNIRVDSVKWKVCMKKFQGERFYHDLSNDNNYSFIVKPEIFGCYFKKMQDENDPYYQDGVAPLGLTLVNPDSSFFQCDVYSGKKIVSSVRSQNFKFDVLPDIPIIRVLDTWTLEEADTFPVSSMGVETDNFDWIIFYITQINLNGTTYITSAILDRNFGMECDVDVGEWGNTVFCWVGNSYGQYKSNSVKIIPTNVKPISQNESKIFAKNGTIYVESEEDVNVFVYSVEGVLMRSCKGVKLYSTYLNPGAYVVVLMKDNAYNKQIQKIYVK